MTAQSIDKSLIRPGTSVSDSPLKGSFDRAPIENSDLAQDTFSFLFNKWNITTLQPIYIMEAIRQAMTLDGKNPETVMVTESGPNSFKVNSPSGNQIWEIKAGAFTSYESMLTITPTKVREESDSWGKFSYTGMFRSNQYQESYFVPDNSRPTVRERVTVRREQQEHDDSLDFSLRAFLNS